LRGHASFLVEKTRLEVRVVVVEKSAQLNEVYDLMMMYVIYSTIIYFKQNTLRNITTSILFIKIL
jgi:hypothetical protein